MRLISLHAADVVYNNDSVVENFVSVVVEHRSVAQGREEVLRWQGLRRLKEFNVAARAWWGNSPEGAAVPDAEQADRARAAMLGFLRSAAERLGADHPAVTSAPRLYLLPAHTPAPVKARGAWDAAAGAARISWKASAAAALSLYEVRWCPGEGYDQKKERTAGRVEGGEAE